MLVIIEGSNKTGKTTGCMEIVKKRKDIFYINNRYVLDLMVDKIYTDVRKKEAYLSSLSMLSLLDELDKLEDKIYLLDRFHLSELVYGKVERNYENEYMYKIDDELSKFKNIKLILLTSKYNYVEDNIELKKLCEIQDEFIKEFSGSKIKNKIKTDRDGLVDIFV